MFASIKSSSIELGNGIEMVLQLETARGWDPTADNVGLGVRSGLPGDDNDRLDASEWLELSVFSIINPENKLSALTLRNLNIQYLNDNPEGERAAVSDGSNTVMLNSQTSGVATYGPNGNLSTLDPLSIDTIASWRVVSGSIE